MCNYSMWLQKRLLAPAANEASSFLTTFITELGRFQYTVVLFVAAEAGDVFQQKLDECCCKLKQIISIADDITVVGYKPDHSDYDQAFTNLLQTAKKCNVKLNYDKLQYKQDEVKIYWWNIHHKQSLAS